MTLKLYGSGSIENIDSIVTSASANISGTELGYIDGVTSALQTQMDAKLPIAGGKILQIVRATDTSDRSTTSTSFVDVTGMSVTITPQKSTSAVIIIASFAHRVDTATDENTYAYLGITDSSNNFVSGAEGTPSVGIFNLTRQNSSFNKIAFSYLTIVGYATPATTSAVTYKLRHRVPFVAATSIFRNASRTGQVFAIEVSA